MKSSYIALGTLTAQTVTQNFFDVQRNHTGATSVTDNFVHTNFRRINDVNNAGGTLLAQGSVVNITATDTQTAGTLTPSYHLLKLDPSLRSTGSSVFVNVSSSVVAAPTNGHIHALLGNTQSVAQTMVKLDTGTSAQNNIGMLVNIYNASTGAFGINIDASTTGTGAGVNFVANI